MVAPFQTNLDFFFVNKSTIFTYILEDTDNPGEVLSCVSNGLINKTYKNRL